MATKSKAPAAKSGGQLNKYDAELAALAKQGVETEENVSLSGTSLKIGAAGFSYQGNQLGTSLRGVFLDHGIENAYYPDQYDAENPMPPACFALGRRESELCPHENSVEPQGGDDGKCATCPLNAFGSGDGGRGKACKNTRRLLFILEDGLEDLDTATVITVKPSVTNLKAWASYVKSLDETVKKATLQVITQMSVVPDAKNQYALSFKPVDDVDGSLIGQLLAKRKANEAMLFAPYAKIEEAPAKPARGAKAKPAPNKFNRPGKPAPAKAPVKQR